jgi:TonB family protein
MRLDVTIACCSALLLVCPVPLQCAQVVSRNTDARNASPRAPLKVGGDVSAPRMIYGHDPEYSETARQAGFEGSCVLRLTVGADGKPYDIGELNTLGMGLDEKAIEAARGWVFEPARRNGKPVAVQIEVEVSFRLYRDIKEMISPEQLEQISERLARVQGRIYKDPEGHNPRPCRAPSSSEGEKLAGPAVTIADLTFDGSLQMTAADQAQISATIRQHAYSGDLDKVTSQALETVKEAWQEHGYWDVQARGDAKILSSSPVNEQIALTVEVDEGRQYRLEQITFRNNREIANIEALRTLFPISNGDIFDRTLIREGLDNLRKAYLQLGHLNFTFVPNTTVDEMSQTARLDTDVDEGKKFYVSRIDIMGLDEAAFQHVTKDLLLKPGDVYDQRLVDLFLEQHASLLPVSVSPDSLIDLQMDERAGTVAIVYDFRHCRGEQNSNGSVTK